MQQLLAAAVGTPPPSAAISSSLLTLMKTKASLEMLPSYWPDQELQHWKPVKWLRLTLRLSDLLSRSRVINYAANGLFFMHLLRFQTNHKHEYFIFLSLPFNTDLIISCNHLEKFHLLSNVLFLKMQNQRRES